MQENKSFFPFIYLHLLASNSPFGCIDAPTALSRERRITPGNPFPPWGGPTLPFASHHETRAAQDLL
jgi:hypothetical protein